MKTSRLCQSFLVMLLAIACKPTPDRPPRPAPVAPEVLSPGGADPFTGLIVSDDHLPWAFKHGVGPKPPAAGFERIDTFPRPPAPPTPEAPRPPRVLRVQPTGEIEGTKSISIHFSEPMVPLSSVGQMRDEPVPATLEPALPGRWRWLGTTLLVFEPHRRLPGSTHFTVTVAQGARSARGATLAETAKFTFSTQPVRARSFYPEYSALPESPIIVTFDQDITPAAMEKFVHLEQVPEEGVPRPVRVRLTTRERFEAHPFVKKHELEWEENRTLALWPEKPLQLDREYRIVVLEGAPSAEGPRLTTRRQEETFSTLGPMRVTQLTCTGLSRKPCRPNFDWSFMFSNEVYVEEDETEFLKFVRVSPSVKELQVSLWGQGGSISGDFRPGTAYTVTILPGVQDHYKQKLAAARTTTIQVADAWPDLQLPDVQMGVLESTSRALRVPAINLLRPANVQLFRVTPELVFRALRTTGSERRWGTSETLRREYGQPAAVWQTTFNRKRNEPETIPLELDRALAGGNGPVLVEVDAPDLRIEREDSTVRRTLVQVSSLGITATHDPERLHVLVTGLADGRPRGGVPVQLFLEPAKTQDPPPRVWEGRTSPDGTVSIPWPAALRSAARTFAVVAGRADAAGREADWAFLIVRRQPRGTGSGSTLDHQLEPATRLSIVRDLVFTDRNPYRPGETVELAGWLRRDGEGPEARLGALELPPDGRAQVEWELRDPRNESVGKGTAPLDRDGAFHVRWTAPNDATLGLYNFHGQVRGVPGIEPTELIGRFSVLAYRPPEHVVSVTIPPAPAAFGDRFTARIEGRYTFGTAMRGAPVEYQVRLEPATFRPPGNPGCEFGEADRPYWRRSSRQLYKGETRLDELGGYTVNETLPKVGQHGTDGPGMVVLEASVSDVNRQSISARGRTLVHPAAFYTGIRKKLNLIRAGEAAGVEVLVVDLDGKPVAGRTVKLRALREIWRRRAADPEHPEDRSWEAVREEKAACEVTSGAKPAACSLTIPDAGFYFLEGVAVDDAGRPAAVRTVLWVVGADEEAWRTGETTRLSMTLDKESYLPGEKAKLIVQAPFYPATGVLTVDREGIVSTRVFEVKSALHVEELSLGDRHLPNLWATVTLLRGRVKPAPGAHPDSGAPRVERTSLSIPIRLDHQRLNVTAKPVKALLQPGQTAELELVTTDAKGAPVQARLAIMLVDEGVLSLLGYALPDPLAVFFPGRRSMLWHGDLRPAVLPTPRYEPPQRETPDLEAPYEDTDGATVGYGSGRGGGSITLNGGAGHGRAVSIRMSSASMPPAQRARSQRAGDTGGFEDIALRGNFATTAYYNDRVLTGADGRGRLKFRMPDNLTTFRVMVLAMDKTTPDRFGAAEDRVTVRKDFMIRAALPRFSNHGDVFEAAVVLTSLAEQEGPAEVKIGGTGFTLLDPDTRTVTLGPGRSEEVRFRVSTNQPGSARFTFAARHLGATDGVKAPPIPVHVPASTENTAVYGMTDAAVLQPVVPPGKVFPQFGGLDVHVSSTGLSGLQDAAQHLFENGWECSEAEASRLVPIFSLREILPKFGIGAAGDPARLEELARKGIADLLKYQDPDGGFRLWPGGIIYPYSSIYITWALLRAREAGFAVPDESLRRATGYLTKVLRGVDLHKTWWYYSYSLRIYAGWVLTELARLQVLTPQELDAMQLTRHLYQLYGERAKVGFLARAWLLHALWRLEGTSEYVRTLLRDLENSVVETAAGAHFAESAADGLALLMHSEARTDAVVLRVLLDVNPKHLLLPKVVRGLMSSRVRGGWGSSQGNAFVLDALAAYFRVIEAEEPDFTMNVWYDKLFAGTKRFRGRSLDIVHARVPMRTLLEHGAGGVLLSKDGPGRLYYRLGMAYVPAALDLPPESQGLTVARTYESLDDDPKSVEEVSPGRWRIRAGATVLVKLTLTAPDRRDFVALSDPLPAGLEGVDTRLDTAPRLPQRKATGPAVVSTMGWWWWHAPSHWELRDDRFVAYYDALQGGTYEYAYLARATTLGTFSAPPPRAVEMYHPEVFGRGPREQVEVVP